MVPYVARRLLQALLLLLALSVAVFGLLFLAPADPAQVIAAQRLGDAASAEQVAVIAHRYGLDQPWPVQYARWLWALLQGDLGYSLRTDQPVASEIGPALRFSVKLGLMTLLVVVVVGTTTGILAALQRGKLGDHFTRIIALAAVSIPEFWLAFLLILVFAVYLGWLPSFGSHSYKHLILPVLALGLGQTARLSRLTRSMLLDQLQQDYLRTTRAKGLSPRISLLRHALPNLAVPYVTVLAYTAASLISGSVIIETLFSLPGLGGTYVTAVDHRDLPMIQTSVLVFTTMIVALNLLADISYGLFDPRIRLDGSQR